MLPVEVHAIHGTLLLRAGATRLSIPCCDGDGTAAVRLEHDAVTALDEGLRLNANRVGRLHVFVEPSDGSLFLCDQDAADVAAQAAGTPIPLAPEPLPTAAALDERHAPDR